MRHFPIQHGEDPARAVMQEIAGPVVAVHDGQAVRRGQLLFRLDAAPFDNAVSSARAAMDAVGLRMEAEKRDYQRLLREGAAHQAPVQSDPAARARGTGTRPRG